MTPTTPSTPARGGLFWPVAPARHRVGARLFRILVGLGFLYQFGILYGQRALLFGPEALNPYDDFATMFGWEHYSLLALSPSEAWFEFVYHATLLVLGVWTAGIATRWTTPLVWLGVHTLHARAADIWDGGDNLMHIVLLFAVLLDLRPAAPREAPAATPREGEGDAAPVGVRDVLHNVALLACAIQVCIVYVVAGITKLGGKYWVNGTAFYYVLNSNEFGFSRSLAPIIWNSPLVLSVMTWAPVVMQLAFPFVYLFGSAASRRVLVLTAISFHLGIFALMGLETFAVFMIAAELLLLSNDDYAFVRRVFGAVRSLPARLRGPTRPATAPPDRPDASGASGPSGSGTTA